MTKRGEISELFRLDINNASLRARRNELRKAGNFVAVLVRAERNARLNTVNTPSCVHFINETKA